jgi:hypothetical protein
MTFRTPWRVSVSTLLLVALCSVAAPAGPIPNILIWQPGFTLSQSGQELLADLATLGEDAALDDDLFAYSPDLSDHEIVIGVVGFMPDTHVIDATEGGAMDAYVQNGGLLLLEGGDCFNYDPEVFGGYDVRPIFGLNDGSDGSGVFTGDVLGIGELAAFNFDFDYLGESSLLDELVPTTSTAILRKATNQDVLAVFHAAYGGGRSVAFSCEYGGLFDFPNATSGKAAGLTTRQQLLAAVLDLLRGTVSSVPDGGATPGFALHPAAPNPFSGVTTIRYELGGDDNVQLAIYDVAGRRVRTLADGPEGQGIHTVHWDGRDDAGNRVASGVYFFSLDTKAAALRRRVVVLK